MFPVLLQRIRPVNLLIIVLTQGLLRYTLLIPILEMNGAVSPVGHGWFFLLLLSTLLIAAGGYLINDADDAVIDALNKTKITGPELQSTLKYYGTMLLLAGVITGFCISFFGNLKTVWGIQLFAGILLYHYSSQIKKMPLLAALTVSLLTVMTIMVVYTSDSAARQIPAIRKLVLGYSLFAFLLSMAREIIKDMQDVQGDEQAGRKTLPIMAGGLFSRVISAFLLLAVVVLLVWIQVSQQQWTSIPAFVYVILFIQLPLLVLSVKIFFDKSPSQWAQSSQWCRLVMLAGVFTMPLFYFIL
jgi:4-hydroxybenzoate polyprenyltransferase